MGRRREAAVPHEFVILSADDDLGDVFGQFREHALHLDSEPTLAAGVSPMVEDHAICDCVQPRQAPAPNTRAKQARGRGNCPTAIQPQTNPSNCAWVRRAG